ncbi:MAG: hypothetical protein H0T61_03525 [Actinobacteria bacterium]|nr:hypothetical protein [Actinomycetota bacterium]
MSRLRGLLDRQNESSDVESEREALQRQRLDAAAEIESLKAALADRVAHVQVRERELEQALTRVAKREQELAAAKGPRLKAVGAWLAEAQSARASRSDEREQAAMEELRSELAAVREALASRELELAEAQERSAGEGALENGALDAKPSNQEAVRAEELDARILELDARAADLDEREAYLNEATTQRLAEDGSVAPPADDMRERELAARETALAAAERDVAEREGEEQRRAEELEALERALADRASALSEQEQARAGEHEEAARAEARLEELRSADLAFVRTRAELAARSDALAEQELQLAVRERALLARETPPTAELDALEARIRRLEQRGRGRRETTQTFSAGLRSLQDRSQRTPVDDRPLN